MHIWFFTHSTTKDNENGVASGHNDVSLSAKGIAQATKNSVQLKEFNFDAIYASDLLRSRQSAEILFDSKPIIYDAALREMNYGVLNGAAFDEFPKNPYGCIEHAFKQGECCLDVEARMRRFLLNVNQDDIAIVGHKYSQLALDVICGGKSWKKAINDDWRKTSDWQLCWEYSF